MSGADLIPLGIGLFGLLFFLIGVFALKGPRQRGRLVANGVITGFSATPPAGVRVTTDSLGARYPVVRFETPDGEHIETTSRLGTNLGQHRHQSVVVFYDPADPHRAVVDAPLARGCVGYAFVTVGGIVTVIGLTVFVAVL